MHLRVSSLAGLHPPSGGCRALGGSCRLRAGRELGSSWLIWRGAGSVLSVADSRARIGKIQNVFLKAGLPGGCVDERQAAGEGEAGAESCHQDSGQHCRDPSRVPHRPCGCLSPGLAGWGTPLCVGTCLVPLKLSLSVAPGAVLLAPAGCAEHGRAASTVLAS